MIPVEIEVDVDEVACPISVELTGDVVLHLANVASRIGNESGGTEDEDSFWRIYHGEPF